MTPSNANTSGLENAGHIVWWKAGGVSYYPEGEAFTVSKSCRVEPLVTAASAQARIAAAEARADRLAKIVKRVGVLTVEGKDHTQFANDFPSFAGLVAEARAEGWD